MEGPSSNRTVENYSELGEYYDELLQDEESLPLWLDVIEERPFVSLLELASGSACITGILEKKGYQVKASDISEKMREVSRRNYSGEYLLLDMTDFHLGKTYDVVLCIVDSINYLEEEELSSCFRCVYEHLEEKGRFIFDMHHEARLKEFAEEYIEEGYVRDVPYQWAISADPFERTLQECFTFYTDEGMLQEHHLQHVFSPEMIRRKLKECGFRVEIREDFVEEEKILVIGEKL